MAPCFSSWLFAVAWLGSFLHACCCCHSRNRAGAAGLLRPARNRSGPGPSAERLHPGDRCRARLAGTLIGPDGVPGIRATKAQDAKTDHANDAVAIPNVRLRVSDA